MGGRGSGAASSAWKGPPGKVLRSFVSLRLYVGPALGHGRGYGEKWAGLKVCNTVSDGLGGQLKPELGESFFQFINRGDATHKPVEISDHIVNQMAGDGTGG